MRNYKKQQQSNNCIDAKCRNFMRSSGVQEFGDWCSDCGYCGIMRKLGTFLCGTFSRHSEGGRVYLEQATGWQSNRTWRSAYLPQYVVLATALVLLFLLPLRLVSSVSSTTSALRSWGNRIVLLHNALMVCPHCTSHCTCAEPRLRLRTFVFYEIFIINAAWHVMYGNCYF